MRFKKIIGLIHLWLGLLSGLVIFIVAITGAMYVFQEEIDNFVHRNEYFVEKQNKPQASLKTWMDSADAGFSKFNHQTGGRTISWYNNSNRVVSVSAAYEESGEEKNAEVLLNPYTAKQIIRPDGGGGGFHFWGTVVDLHISLMLGDVGTYIVDFASLIALIMLISGIILWWPKNKNAAKQRFRFRWKKGLTWKRKNYDLHNILGFYASWIAVFIVITGITFAFGWVRESMYFLLSGRQQPAGTEQAEVHDTTKTNAAQLLYAYNKMTEMAAREFATAGSCYISYPSDTSGTIYVSFGFNPKGITELEYRYFVFDRVSLKLVEETPTRKNAGDWFNVYYARIHYGSIFGLPSKLLAFFASLIVASLPITGFLVWLGRRRNGKKGNKVSGRVVSPNYVSENKI